MAAPHLLLAPLLAGDPIPSDAVIDDDVAASAEEHGVAALLDGIIDQLDLPVEDTARRTLAMRALQAKAEVEAAATTLATVQDAADELGIDTAVFKGAALGARLYPEPERRPSLDVDIFVNPAHLPRLGELAHGLGASEPERAGIDAMVAEGRVFEHSVSTDGTTVDIHRDPMNMILTAVDDEARWERTEFVGLPDGSKARTLDLEDTLIQALLHAFRDNFADLLHCNDIRLLIAEQPDWDEVQERAALNGWTDLVRYATWFVSEVFAQPSPLPTTITRWRKLAIDRIWPRSLLLQGPKSVTHSERRQSALGALAAGRTSDLANAYTRRALPPRSVIEARSGDTDAGYVRSLAEWRLQQRDRMQQAKADSE